MCEERVLFFIMYLHGHLSHVHEYMSRKGCSDCSDLLGWKARLICHIDLKPAGCQTEGCSQQ